MILPYLLLREMGAIHFCKNIWKLQFEFFDAIINQKVKVMTIFKYEWASLHLNLKKSTEKLFLTYLRNVFHILPSILCNWLNYTAFKCDNFTQAQPSDIMRVFTDSWRKNTCMNDEFTLPNKWRRRLNRDIAAFYK